MKPLSLFKSFFGTLILVTFLVFSCKQKAPVDLQITQMDHEEVKKRAAEIESTVTPTLAEGLSMRL